MSEESVARVVLPVAILTGTVHLRGGPPDTELLSATLPALCTPTGQECPRGYSPFPASMTADLLARAVARGWVVFPTGNRIPEGRPSVPAATGERIETAWAVDLLLGTTHRFSWIAKNERQEARASDLLITPSIEPKDSISRIKAADLRGVVRNMDVPRVKLSPEEFQAWRQALEDRADRVEGLTLARTMDVAIPIRHHQKGKVERWLVGGDPPLSVLACLRQSVPQLNLKINVRDLRLGFARSPALQLLESIDDFWEMCRWDAWNSTLQETRHIHAEDGLTESASWLDEWQDPTEPASDVESAIVRIGPASLQGDAFSAISRSVKSRLVVLTSFLNPKFAEWVAELLGNLHAGAGVLVLYGHANSEDAEARERSATAYENLLRSRLPKSIILTVRPTTVRSHEKILVADSSWVMLGSWNVGSSPPHASYLEGSVVCRSRSLASDLLTLLTEEADETASSFLKDLRASLEPTSGHLGLPLRPRLQALHSLFQSILDQGLHEVRDWRNVRKQLTALRDVLWTHFASPRLELVRGEDVRDVLVEQIESARHALTIASDRVNETGLDDVASENPPRR